MSAREAVDLARSGGGPTLIECKTYRTRAHAEGMGDFTYRTREQVEEEKVSEALFPYGWDFTPAGCLGVEGLRDEPAGFLCSSCVEARADWLAEFSAKNKE